MPFQKQVVAAEVMVIRSCSCSIQSMVGAIMDFTDLVVNTGVVEDALGRRGLAGVDVRADTDVAVALDGVLRATVFIPLFKEPSGLRFREH